MFLIFDSFSTLFYYFVIGFAIPEWHGRDLHPKSSAIKVSRMKQKYEYTLVIFTRGQN